MRRAAAEGAGCRTGAQVLLDYHGSMYFAGLHIYILFEIDYVRPMMVARLTPSGSKATQFLQVLPVDYVNGVIREIGDINTALL